MDSKRSFDDESSNDQNTVLSNNSEDNDTDGEFSAVKKGLPTRNSLEDIDTDNDSLDEDDWHAETEVSSVESKSDDDSGPDLSRICSQQNHRSVSKVFLSKSGRRWSTSEPAKRKIPPANILREKSCIGRAAVGIQAVSDAFHALFTEDMISIIVGERDKRASTIAAQWNDQNVNKKWQWKETNSDEIFSIIGLLILGGVQRSQNEHLIKL
jgi:hypothetical protein